MKTDKTDSRTREFHVDFTLRPETSTAAAGSSDVEARDPFDAWRLVAREIRREFDCMYRLDAVREVVSAHRGVTVVVHALDGVYVRV